MFQPDLSALPVKSALKKSTGKYGHDATMPPHLSGRLLVPPQMRRPTGSGTAHAASATTKPQRSSLKQVPSSKWAAGTVGAKAFPAATTAGDASAAASDSTAAAASDSTAAASSDSTAAAASAPAELPAPSQGAYLAVTPGLERTDEPMRMRSEAPTTKIAASTAAPRVPPPARVDADERLATATADALLHGRVLKVSVQRAGRGEHMPSGAPRAVRLSISHNKLVPTREAGSA